METRYIICSHCGRTAVAHKGLFRTRGLKLCILFILLGLCFLLWLSCVDCILKGSFYYSLDTLLDIDSYADWYTGGAVLFFILLIMMALTTIAIIIFAKSIRRKTTVVICETCGAIHALDPAPLYSAGWDYKRIRKDHNQF